MPEHVTLFEMSPRDGLQNETDPVATADKIRLIDLLSAAGFRKIEAASFVSPKWVPQMADGAEVMAGLTRAPGVAYAALTPNLHGYTRARAAGADEVAVFAAASEGFSRANTNCTIDEGFARFAPIVEAARGDGVPVRGYVSVALDCPYDGPTPPGDAARVAARLMELGCYEVSLADTTGMATPEATDAMLAAVLEVVPPDRLAGHFHDTGGRALENIGVALARGLRVFDASAGGLGGCPYSPGAEGNVATEAVAEMLAAKGFTTGIDPVRLAGAAAFARGLRRAGRGGG